VLSIQYYLLVQCYVYLFMQNLDAVVIISDSMSHFATEHLTPTKVASYIMGGVKCLKCKLMKKR
jgi:hypothetical protein